MKMRPVHKCLLCGDCNYGEIVEFKDIESAKYRVSFPGYDGYLLHECSDGSVGLARFTGFKMEVDEEETDKNGE